MPRRPCLSFSRPPEWHRHFQSNNERQSPRIVFFYAKMTVFLKIQLPLI
jgi:hypothetical protein